jgi:DNA mismatch repair protein MutS
VKANGLRHILIEQLQQTELYVPNDIHIGQETNGMLLFGANTCGKTSNMRALGIAIVLAQAGMCVPCTSFCYKPYKSLYSRIVNQDNLFKGLSTFAVEMSELRTILKYADENSLVLGDELCSGTETISALSIMMSSLMQLDGKKCSFIFTTHFHEIVNFEEMKALQKVKCYHLVIQYNAEKEKMEYDRILREGSGPPSYGLEVCESLYMDPVFLTKAYEIRTRYFPGEYEGSLHLSKSRYNAKKLKGKCEICGKMSDEIHHKIPQKDANKEGMVKPGIHKNNVANLMALCESCHDQIHHTKNETDTVSLSPLSADNTAEPSEVSKKVIKRIVKRRKV